MTRFTAWRKQGFVGELMTRWNRIDQADTCSGVGKNRSTEPLFDCSNFSLHSDKGTTRQTDDVDAPAHRSS